MKLPEFSKATAPQWWEFLQPFLEAKTDVSKMRPLKVREYERERTPFNSRTEKFGHLKGSKTYRKRYFSDISTKRRDHLVAVARQRDAGLL
jgi:hypothetical protein